MIPIETINTGMIATGMIATGMIATATIDMEETGATILIRLHASKVTVMVSPPVLPMRSGVKVTIRKDPISGKTDRMATTLATEIADSTNKSSVTPSLRVTGRVTNATAVTINEVTTGAGEMVVGPGN